MAISARAMWLKLIGSVLFESLLVSNAEVRGQQTIFNVPTTDYASGYFTPGVIFKPHARVTAYAGYSLGNSSLKKGNHFFLLEVGYNY